MVGTKRSASISKYTDFFGKGIPSGRIIFIILIIASIVVSIASVALVRYTKLATELPSIAISGTIFSIIALIIPTILTIFFIKIAIRKVYVKHIIFLSFIGELSFSIYILIGSILYIIFGVPIAIVAIIVGAASIFGWWFFAGKVLLSKIKTTIPIALVQPLLYILFYIPASTFFFNPNIPINVLLIKFFAGIIVFAIVIYAIISVFNRPLKKGLGMNGIDTFSAMFQDWLFGISTQLPFGKEYGERITVKTDTLLFKITNTKLDKEIKAIFFIPNIHYGAMGNIGGSNFPYLIERRTNTKYNAHTFVMHTAVNEDLNPTFAHEISKLNLALDSALTNMLSKRSGIKILKGESGGAYVTELRFDTVSVVIMTRAPNVTEDISPDVAVLFKKLLESDKSRMGKSVILIDAHNSRMESASESELNGVKMNTKYMNDYVEAIKNIALIHESKRLKVGVSSTEIYRSLGSPIDIANGNLNAMIFDLNNYKYGILQFNSNNMLPSLRDEIIKYAKRKYDIEIEVCTTDTHAVNSISIPASNVLGRVTKFKRLKPYIDSVIKNAVNSTDNALIGYEYMEIKNFSVWGINSRERISAVFRSIIALAKVLVPTIIIAGFIAAVWIVSFI